MYRAKRQSVVAGVLLYLALLVSVTACQSGPVTQSSGYGQHGLAVQTTQGSSQQGQPNSSSSMAFLVPHKGGKPVKGGTATTTATVTPTSGSPTPGSPTPGATATAQGTSSAGSPPGPVPSGGGSLPQGFPHYFSFGVMNAPGAVSALNAMRSTNGTNYAFRYQYLTGGVNTGHGWETWNQPAGQFAMNYMLESSQNGYVPVFVYYELCLTNGPQSGSYCGGHNIQQDTGNLSSASAMNAYYANWVLMLQKIGAFGKPVLVIVEPDLWGFLQNASNGTDDASTVPASVSTSGFADAAGFPNTAQGFAWALLHMRDKYAPNAVLALHASCWAAGADIATDTSTNLDVAGLVQREAHFLNTAGLTGNPVGVSSWDLLSNDVADFDSAQPGGRSWWDRYNQTFPNFSRYLSFIGQLSQATHHRVVMWQVPMGNQYFDTMNNTPGHYQDNRAEYILSNVASFAAAGVIAVLFGPGNGGTMNTDAMNDGVTNPSPTVSYECNMCNSHVSSYPDDDGGYLRIFVGQYMQHPIPLS